MTIEDKGNRILAHFMGVEWTPELNYHKDWNSLLSVWVKLRDYQNKTPIHVTITDNYVIVRENRILDSHGIIQSIVNNDIRTTWSLITGRINKHILTEEEYLKFKNEL